MTSEKAITILVMWLIGYFLPVIIAVCRRHQNSLAIGILTLLTGWTIIGWIVALVWSCTKPERAR